MNGSSIHLATHVLFFLIFILLLPPAALPAAEVPDYTLAVLPQMPPVTMHTNWAPFVERLSRETGLLFSLKLYESMDQFEEDVIRGKPDFVYLHSAQMVGAKVKQGYVPVVRSSRPVAGTFVVRKDSTIASLDELQGRTVAFVGKKNLCRALLDHVLIDEQGLTIRPVYAGTASNMLKHVILSKADAGGTLDISLEKLPPELLSQVRVLYATEKIAPHALAAHPRIPARVRSSVAEAIIRMGSDSECSSIMAAVQIESPIKADYARDYRELEQSNLHRYFGASE